MVTQVLNMFILVYSITWQLPMKVSLQKLWASLLCMSLSTDVCYSSREIHFKNVYEIRKNYF